MAGDQENEARAHCDADQMTYDADRMAAVGAGEACAGAFGCAMSSTQPWTVKPKITAEWVDHVATLNKMGLQGC